MTYSTRPARINITEDRYPIAPNADSADLLALYSHLRRDAQTLSRSRGRYIGLHAKAQDQVEALSQELQAFAEDASLALQEKARLNQIVAKYGEIFEAFETAGDELVDSMAEYERGAVTIQGFRPIRRLLSACRAFVQAWKAAKDMGADMEDLNNGLIS